jgi:hypothetical protein
MGILPPCHFSADFGQITDEFEHRNPQSPLKISNDSGAAGGVEARRVDRSTEK